MAGNRDYYTIGELSKIFKVGVDTIRYYEEKGLLAPVRGENGYRYYDLDNIWRMSVIADLRDLDFSVERIGLYLRDRSIASTDEILTEELGIIEERLKKLRGLKKIVAEQRENLRNAQQIVQDEVRILKIKPRRAFETRIPHETDEEMDLLMQRLLVDHSSERYLIGSNCMAEVLSEDPDGPIYQAALMFDERGDIEIPGGTFLSLCYSGRADSVNRACMLKSYAEKNGIRIIPPFLDVIWIDVHSSADYSEHINEMQVRAEL